MVELQPIFRKAYWSLVAFGGLYASFLLLLTHPAIQKHAIYAHKVHTAYFEDLNKPERLGFAKNQITPFNLTTADGEDLYAWHVLPLGLYSKYEMELQKQDPWPPSDFKSTLAHKLLMEDEEARVVINFHGNAGHVAQGYRPLTYRSLTSSNSKIHVFTLDYRGFGLSSGSPTEAGLIQDGVSMVLYVLSLGIPPSRIILLGQSLGTQVASAVALHFADHGASIKLLPDANGDVNLHETSPLIAEPTESTDFAAVILVASFPSIEKLLKVYRLSGLVPVLSPLRVYPRIQTFLLGFVREYWNTADRLAALTETAAEPGRKLRLHVIHARDDRDINYKMGEANFFAAEKALAGVAKEPLGSSMVGDWGETRRREAWLEDREDSEDSRVRLIFELQPTGGHNRIVSDVSVALAVLRGFGLA